MAAREASIDGSQRPEHLSKLIPERRLPGSGLYQRTAALAGQHWRVKKYLAVGKRVVQERN